MPLINNGPTLMAVTGEDDNWRGEASLEKAVEQAQEKADEFLGSMSENHAKVVVLHVTTTLIDKKDHKACVITLVLETYSDPEADN